MIEGGDAQVGCSGVSTAEGDEENPPAGEAGQLEADEAGEPPPILGLAHRFEDGRVVSVAARHSGGRDEILVITRNIRGEHVCLTWTADGLAKLAELYAQLMAGPEDSGLVDITQAVMIEGDAERIALERRESRLQSLLALRSSAEPGGWLELKLKTRWRVAEPPATPSVNTD
jgi:hypothetical protein